jgi:hypothetical protein
VHPKDALPTPTTALPPAVETQALVAEQRVVVSDPVAKRKAKEEVKMPAEDLVHPKVALPTPTTALPPAVEAQALVAEQMVVVSDPVAKGEVKMPAEDLVHPEDALPTPTTALPPAVETQALVAEQSFVVSDPVAKRKAKGESKTEERQDDLFETAPDDKDCKKAADAVRKWLKMMQKNRRERRQRRLRLLQKMEKIRLQRLKAARLEMKRQMQADFGANNDPGLETRIGQEKHESTIAPRTHYRDPRKMLSLLLRLLRAMLRATKTVRER